jgi:hypothetical protein
VEMGEGAFHGDDDAAHRFRENDNVGSDSSLLVRTYRQFLKDGKPVGPVLMLTVSLPSQPGLPLGTLSQTKKERLIFWPPLPQSRNMTCDGTPVEAIDHITLQFPSERVHVTAYGAKQEDKHESRAWRLGHLDDLGLALWFYLLVRIPVLREQDLAVQRQVKIPPSDKERRLNVFRQFKLPLLDISLPPHGPEQDYIYLGFYLARDLAPADQLPANRILPAKSLTSQVEGGPTGNTFEITGRRFQFGKRIIAVTTACPSGRLLSDVTIGFSCNK